MTNSEQNRAPTEIKLHKKSATLELCYDDKSSYTLSAEFLRISSPSAEVRGHGKGQEILQTGKKNVAIVGIEPVGNYAVKLDFDDGHDTGIYSWDYLWELCADHDSLWAAYLGKLEQANASRESLEPGVQVVNIMPLNSKDQANK